jgi:HSP20 family protein
MWGMIPWKSNKHNGGLMPAEPIDRQFSRLRDDFDQLLTRMWGGSPTIERLLGDHWGLDVDETDSHYVAHIEAPGFEVADFEVKSSGRQLVIKAEHKDEKKGKNGSSYRYGRFERMLALPEDADVEHIDAQYHAGILELKVPKGKEAQNVKRISVKSAEASAERSGGRAR